MSTPSGSNHHPRRDDARTVRAAPAELVVALGSPGTPGAAFLARVGRMAADSRGVWLLEKPAVSGTTHPTPGAPPRAGLLPWLAASANVFMAVDITTPYLTVAAKRQRAAYYLRLLHLEGVAERPVLDLDPERRVRVALARAWAFEPEVLLLDEPFAGLAPAARLGLERDLAHLWTLHRTTIVMATDDVDEALRLADRVVPLTGGPGVAGGGSIAVPLPRPRIAERLATDPKYLALREHVLECVRGPRAPRALGAAAAHRRRTSHATSAAGAAA